MRPNKEGASSSVDATLMEKGVVVVPVALSANGMACDNRDFLPVGNAGPSRLLGTQIPIESMTSSPLPRAGT